MMSSEVHIAWQQRNDWVFDPNYGNPEQAVPYINYLKRKKQKIEFKFQQVQKKFNHMLREKLMLIQLFHYMELNKMLKLYKKHMNFKFHMFLLQS